jgi:transposase
MNELIFSPEVHLTVEDIKKIGHHLDIYARSERSEAICPDCDRISPKIHGSYWRHPQDLPCLGLTVRLHLEVQRFACKNPACSRKTFAEGFVELLPPKARRTNRLKEQHLATAYVLGGEAGGQLSGVLGMPISGDTLIREIRQAPDPAAMTVRVVGVDDWAQKKGQNYGTILVDLEQGRPIDLLGSREADEVTTWFQAHPEIEVISRDRGKQYIKAATEGAPQAEQVADRWHLLNNLREAVTTFLQQKPACLQAPSLPDQSPETEDPFPPPEERTKAEPSLPPVTNSEERRAVSQADQARAAAQARRQEKYAQVRHLHQTGSSDRAIARQLTMSPRTVRRYIEADTCPQYPAGRVGPSKLSRWLPYLEQRWQAGCTNASQLWREIVEQGFSGSLGLVIRWAVSQRKLLPAENRYCRQQAPGINPDLARQVNPLPWSAQRAAWLVILTDDKLDDDEQAARTRMLAADTEMVTVDHLARQFVEIVKERRLTDLGPWLNEVAASGIKALKSFANGLRVDLAAVRNALRLSWSNGQTEGQINRLKLMKRQMYGRAKLDLLRKRVLYHPPRI